jgi:hypothetical protein
MGQESPEIQPISERANSKLSVNLIAEKPTVPTAMYLGNAFHIHGGKPKASLTTGESQLSQLESATIPF